MKESRVYCEKSDMNRMESVVEELSLAQDLSIGMCSQKRLTRFSWDIIYIELQTVSAVSA